MTEIYSGWRVVGNQQWQSGGAQADIAISQAMYTLAAQFTIHD